MALAQVLYTRLTTHAGLSALIGTRVYPLVAPEDVTLPAVIYRRVGTQPVSAMGSDPGLQITPYQLDAYDDDYAGARAVAIQIKAALQRWRQVGPPEVQDVYLRNEIEMTEDEDGVIGPGPIYRVLLEFDIAYVEA